MLLLGKVVKFKKVKLSKIRVLWLKKHLISVFLALFVYTLNRFYLKHLNIPYVGIFLKNQFSDLIGGFVFPSYVNTLLVTTNRLPIKRFFSLFVFMLGVSLLWEYVFPIFLSYSTSDIYDVLAYQLGTILYYFIMYKDNNKIV